MSSTKVTKVKCVWGKMSPTGFSYQGWQLVGVLRAVVIATAITKTIIITIARLRERE
jgi:hypothetical protein